MRHPGCSKPTETCDPRVERTRHAALSAARELLEEEGWDAVTHVAVSERSGISRTTLYRHWPTSEKLMREAVAEKLSLAQPKPCGVLIDDLVGHLETFRVMTQDSATERNIATVLERASVDPQFASLRRALTKACTHSLVQILKCGVATGQLDADLDLERAVDELVGPLAFRRFFARGRVTKVFVVEVVKDFLASHGTPSAAAQADPAGALQIG